VRYRITFERIAEMNGFEVCERLKADQKLAFMGKGAAPAALVQI
jgi:CheY-like chemotaxis protein